MNRRTKAQWRALFDEQQTSGLNATEFCRRESINPKYFSLRKRELSPSSLVRVVPSARLSEPDVKSIKIRVIEFDLPQSSLSESLDILLNSFK